MAKYVRSKRRTIGGNHHHKGKAKKGKGKSKGKKKGCSTVKKCRAEIKKLETRIRKIKSRKKKPKTRRRVRMRTPKELESMYMEGESGKGATGFALANPTKGRAGKTSHSTKERAVLNRISKGISFGFGVALKSLVLLLIHISNKLKECELLPSHMEGEWPAMNYKEGNMVKIIEDMDKALKIVLDKGTKAVVSWALSASLLAVVNMGKLLGDKIQTLIGDNAMKPFKSMLNAAKKIVGKYPVEDLPKGAENSIRNIYHKLYSKKG